MSLNAQDAEVYGKLSQPQFGAPADEAVKEFLREAKKYIPEVAATAVSAPGVDTEACRKIVDGLGAGFRVREYNVAG